eukprot:5234296-Prymnesium_polylepis.1
MINSDASTGSQAAVLGSILFNFGFVTTVPSWVNEKHPAVHLNRSLWTATTFCVAVVLAVGVPGAVAFQSVLEGPVMSTCPQQLMDPDFNCASDVMQVRVCSQRVWWPR